MVVEAQVRHKIKNKNLKVKSTVKAHPTQNHCWPQKEFDGLSDTHEYSRVQYTGCWAGGQEMSFCNMSWLRGNRFRWMAGFKYLNPCNCVSQSAVKESYGLMWPSCSWGNYIIAGSGRYKRTSAVVYPFLVCIPMIWRRFCRACTWAVRTARPFICVCVVNSKSGVRLISTRVSVAKSMFAIPQLIIWSIVSSVVLPRR